MKRTRGVEVCTRWLHFEQAAVVPIRDLTAVTISEVNESEGLARQERLCASGAPACRRSEGTGATPRVRPGGGVWGSAGSADCELAHGARQGRAGLQAPTPYEPPLPAGHRLATLVAPLPLRCQTASSI